MYSETDIDIRHRAAGAFCRARPLTALRQLMLTALRVNRRMADEEHFRLITGFNDIFVAIAGVLVLTGWRGMGMGAACLRRARRSTGCGGGVADWRNISHAKSGGWHCPASSFCSHLPVACFGHVRRHP